MLCSNCASPNPDGARFCSDCGTMFFNTPPKIITPQQQNPMAEAAPQLVRPPDYAGRQVATLVLPTTEALPQQIEKSTAVLPINPPSLAVAGGQDEASNRLAKLVVGSVLLLALISGTGLWLLRKSADSDARATNPTERSDQNSEGTTPKEKRADRPAPPPQMTYVPGGEFLMGSNSGDEYERPPHRVRVATFFIDTNEVTREQYAEFIRATGRASPPSWQNNQYPAGTARWPVTGINWDDANAYACWAGKRLPTEEEWEFAARGTDGRRYPWGNEWKQNAANAGSTSRGRLTDVGERSDGASSSGALDMIGNAWEWTSSDLKAYSGGRLPREPVGEVKVIRGGSWQEKNATATYRGYLLARGGKDYSNTGFRCVKDVQSSFVSQ